MDIDNLLLLRPLHVSDEHAFTVAYEEFKMHEPGYEFAFNYDPSINFPKYVRKLERWTQGLDLPEKFVPSTFLVGVIGGRIVGRISIRHTLNDFLASIGGHVGYGVVPCERKKGYGTEMLRLALPVALSLGISRLLITCDEDNAGSRRIIEKNSGVFENCIREAGSVTTKLRYWIDLTG